MSGGSGDRRPAVTRRRFLGGVLAGAAVATVPAGARAALRAAPADRLSLALVRTGSPEQAAALADFDLTHAKVGDAVEVLLWPGDARRLRDLGLDHEITVPDVLAHHAAEGAGQPATVTSASPVPGGATAYRRLADHESDMASLAAAHPERCRLLTLAHPTHEGRTVHGLEIAARVADSDGRPVFYMDGLHHAREWPSAEHTITFAHDLLLAPETSRLAQLLERVRVVVVPVVNPDGFHHSREAVVDNSITTFAFGAEQAYWRKNRRAVVDDAGADHADRQAASPTAYGTDNNRNYRLLWAGPGTSPLFGYPTYRGPSAESEPETANVSLLGRSLPITAAITNHTYGDLILRPWGHTHAPSPDEGILRSLGAKMAARNGYQSIPGIDLYPTTGTTEDWLYGALGVLAYTFEHGSSFHPGYADVIRQYTDTRDAFLLGLAAAAEPSWHSVLRGRVVSTNGPVPATVTVSRSIASETWEGVPVGEQQVLTYELPAGPFELHVAPSTPPHLAFQHGASAPWTVTVEAAGSSVSLHRTVGRGEVADLGDVVV